MVRLQLDREIRLEGYALPFQSHYGAIATRLELYLRAFETFNPTMVRLQHSCLAPRSCADRTFQSHYGAIATCNIKLPMLCVSDLSIPLWCDCNCEATGMQLKLPDFQSHYGAIATSPSIFISLRMRFFQSHYGAIATCFFYTAVKML